MIVIDLDAAEDNIVARIDSQVALLTGSVVASGDIPAAREAIARDPAAFVGFESETWGEQDHTGNQTGTLTWWVLIKCRSMRGPKEGRKGTEGGYKLSYLVAEALRNFDPIGNVVGPGVNFPMQVSSRQQLAEPDDETTYWMWCRFNHSVDTFA